MDDLISRQAAIRFIRDKVSLSLFMKRSVDKADKACMELCDMLDKELPSAQQWIPCSERLPDQNGKYLVVGRQKAINILKFDGGRWYGKWGVVAWMPLPKTYRDEVSD